jgi:hypothetical protein
MLTYTWALRSAAVTLLLISADRALAAPDVEITSASAHFDMRTRDGTRAALEVGLDVGASGLSRFELFDIASDAVLDAYAPPQFVADDGTVYLPSVRALTGGGIVLEFPDRRSALKPGAYVLRYGWRLPLAAAGSASLRMPSWPNRVANARIVVLAPGGALPVVLGRYDQWRRRDDGAGSELSFTRIELPRTESFAVTLEWPALARTPASTQPLPDARRVLGICLGLALGLCWLVKRRACDAPLPALRTLSLLGCSTFAVGAFDVWPLLAASAGLCASSIGGRGCLGAPGHTGKIAHSQASHYAHDGAGWFEVTHFGGASVALLTLLLLACAEPFAPAAVSCSACLVAVLFLSVRHPPRLLASWRRVHAL